MKQVITFIITITILLNSVTINFITSNADSLPNYGNINADKTIDATDALLVLKHAAKLEQLTTQQSVLAEVNKDNLITSADALLILKYAAKLLDVFPVEKLTNSNTISEKTEYAYKVAYRQIIEYADTIYVPNEIYIDSKDAIGYYLMDIDLNGIPELILELYTPGTPNSYYEVFTFDVEKQFATNIYSDGGSFCRVYYDAGEPGFYFYHGGSMYPKWRKHELINGQLIQTSYIEFPSDQVDPYYMNLDSPEMYEIDNLTPLETE